MPAALALSPHLDDAAFSCGGTLAGLAAAGWRVVMVTVFTATVPEPRGFALACQLDKGLGPEVDYMALRRGEDAAAAAHLGVAALHLPFREAPHRGYDAAPALFGTPRPDDRIADALADAFRDLLERERPDLILAPQAIGGHVDHVRVVEALRAADPAAPVLWWRDFPYTVREAAPRAPLAGLFAEMPARTFALDAAAQARKAAACAAYASQLGFQFGGPAGLAARLAAEGACEGFRLGGELPPGFPGRDA